MDWLKLFTLLVSVTSIHITADAPKKKIRIHLPQKVKHIHHHKKIYITNHPASSQYAPAFMPSAEGTVAVPTNVAMPAVASVLPLNSVELYDEPPSRIPGISSAASKLLPLYHARGYYGPTPTDWDERDYDLDSPAEPIDESYISTAYAAPSAAPIAPPNHPSKRVKIVKLNEPPRKKVPRKNKPKRVTIRNKPQAQLEDEHPVTSFHEQFYSDVDGSGTIKKVKKPQRVEKIIDGDTEHIHTYSEEHIHKIVFDGDKHPRLAPVGSMSALTASHSFVPIKNQQTLIAIAPSALTEFTAVGSMGTPSHLEYAAYNPREVTHDHIFHDHGEIPSNIDLTKNHLPFPPRTSYTSQGLRIGGTKGVKSKYSSKHLRPSLKPDFSYYENVYGSYNKIRSKQKPTIPTPFELSDEASLEDYRPVVQSLKFLKKGNLKTHNVVPALYFGQEKQADVKLQQTSVSGPYSVSSTVVHEYKPKQIAGRAVGPLAKSNVNKNIYRYPNNNFEYDSYASSSNIYANENYPQNYSGKKGKKKSISTQNISFGGLDHQTTVDHLQDSDISQTSLTGGVPTAFDSDYDTDKPLETAPSTAFTIRESSPVHPYYSAMAVKALHNSDQLSLAQASNDNYQYAEAPPPSTTTTQSSVEVTTSLPAEYYEMQNSENIPTESTDYETRSRINSNDQNTENHNAPKDHRLGYKVITIQPKEQTHTSYDSEQNYYNSRFASSSSKLKYGDKI